MPHLLDALIPCLQRGIRPALRQPGDKGQREGEGGWLAGAWKNRLQCEAGRAVAALTVYSEKKVFIDNCPLPGTYNWCTKMESLSLLQAPPLR